MATDLALPAPGRRYTFTVTNAEGVRRNVGRLRLELAVDGDATHAQAINVRSGEAVYAMEVASAVRAGKAFTLTGTDGSTWAISGCGCGSR